MPKTAKPKQREKKRKRTRADQGSIRSSSDEELELTQANMQLEAFKDLIFGLAFVAVIVFIGMALTSEGA
jgi:hypothetical protein